MIYEKDYEDKTYSVDIIKYKKVDDSFDHAFGTKHQWFIELEDYDIYDDDKMVTNTLNKKIKDKLLEDAIDYITEIEG